MRIFGGAVLLALLTALPPLSAEELKFDDTLSGWRLAGKKKVSVDKEIRPESATIRLEGDSSARRILELKQNTRYKLTFLVKGKDISTASGHGARIMLNAGKQWGRITASPGARMDTGTFDWKKGSGIIDTGKFQSGSVALYFSLSGPGTVWFSDVRIEESAEDGTFSTGTLTFDGSLSGWSLRGKGNVAVDSEIKVGSCSARLGDDTRISRQLRLEPETKYELTFYVRGKEIQSGKNQGARIMLNSGTVWRRISATEGGAPDTGTFDWKKGVGIIDTGKFPNGNISLQLALSGSGTVWFDGLEIKKLAETRKENLSWNIRIFPAHFENGRVSFCENLPGYLEIISGGKGDFTGKTAKMYLDVPESLSLIGVCENFTLMRGGKAERIPCRSVATRIRRDGRPYTHYEIVFDQSFLKWFRASWYRHIVFLEPKPGSAGKEERIYWSFEIGQEKQPEQILTAKILAPVSLPKKPCAKFGVWVNSLQAVDSPFSAAGEKVDIFWKSLTNSRFRSARRYRDLSIRYPGFTPVVSASSNNFLSHRDYDGKLSLDFYNAMPKDVTDKGKINPWASSVWSLVDDKDGRYEKYLRTTLRMLKKIYPDMKHLWWDFEPHPYGFDEGGRARFARVAGLKKTPSAAEILAKHSEQYFQYMVKLHAELIVKNAKIVHEELPGVTFWFCSDNLHAAEPHVARWCGVDVSLADSAVDVHMHMPYYTGTRYFDDMAYNIAKLKKPYFPVIDPGERIQSFYRQYSASKVRQNIIATAALGGIGIGFWPDDLLAGEYYHSIADAYAAVARVEDFYLGGKRCDEEISVVAKNAITRKLPGGKIITFPDFSRTIRYTAHKKDGKYLITVFNYDSKQAMIAEISGRNFAPVLVKIPPDGCELVGTELIPEQKSLREEVAVFSGTGEIFKDFRQGDVSASWSADQDGKPLLVLSDGTVSVGVDALSRNEVVSLRNSLHSELFTGGFAGRIVFADRLQPPLIFRHRSHGITQEGFPFAVASAEVAPYEGANPDPNPLYRLQIERRIEIRNGKLVILHRFHNPTGESMPLVCRLNNYPWPGYRFRAEEILLAGKFDANSEEIVSIRKPQWKNLPFELTASSRNFREKIVFAPETKFDGLFSWTLKGKTPRKTVEFLIDTTLPAKRSSSWCYTISAEQK